MKREIANHDFRLKDGRQVEITFYSESGIGSYKLVIDGSDKGIVPLIGQ